MELPVTEYFVIRSNKLDDLVKYVNKSLAEGWQPFGGVGVDGSRRTVSLYYQSVVKYNMPKKDEKGNKVRICHILARYFRRTNFGLS